MAFEPNWNDSQLLKHHSVINRALSPPMGDVKYSWALWSWLGNVAVHRSIFSPLCLQHMCIVSFVFFLCLRGLLCFIHKENLSSLFSVLFLLCVSHAVFCLCIQDESWEQFIKYNPLSIVAKPPCHQPFISCHLLFSPAGWPAVAFYLHTLSLLPRLFFCGLSCFLLHCIILSL